MRSMTDSTSLKAASWIALTSRGIFALKCRTRSDKREGDSSPMAAAEAPELRDRGRVIRLTLTQFPDVHKY